MATPRSNTKILGKKTQDGMAEDAVHREFLSATFPANREKYRENHVPS